MAWANTSMVCITPDILALGSHFKEPHGAGARIGVSWGVVGVPGLAIWERC